MKKRNIWIIICIIISALIICGIWYMHLSEKKSDSSKDKTMTGESETEDEDMYNYHIHIVRFTYPDSLAKQAFNLDWEYIKPWPNNIYN